jgi:hypothetical protein
MLLAGLRRRRREPPCPLCGLAILWYILKSRVGLQNPNRYVLRTTQYVLNRQLACQAT